MTSQMVMYTSLTSSSTRTPLTSTTKIHIPHSILTSTPLLHGHFAQHGSSPCSTGLAKFAVRKLVMMGRSETFRNSCRGMDFRSTLLDPSSNVSAMRSPIHQQRMTRKFHQYGWTFRMQALKVNTLWKACVENYAGISRKTLVSSSGISVSTWVFFAQLRTLFHLPNVRTSSTKYSVQDAEKNMWGKQTVAFRPGWMNMDPGLINRCIDTSPHV